MLEEENYEEEKDGELNIVKVKLKYGPMVFLPQNQIKKKITINIKTFFHQRKIFTFNVDI